MNKAKRVGIDVSRVIVTGGKLVYSECIVMDDGTYYERKTSQFLHIIRKAAQTECAMLDLPLLTSVETLEKWEKTDGYKQPIQTNPTTDKPVI